MQVADQPIAIWREQLKARPPLLHAREIPVCLGLSTPLATNLTVANLIEPICTDLDFFRNHAARRLPTSMDFARVYAVGAPSAVLSGLSALLLAGVVSCIRADLIELSVVDGHQVSPPPKHAGIDVRAHAVRWRHILECNGVLTKAAIAGGEVGAMTPGAALAELLIYEPKRSPDPDMIDFRAISDIDQHRMRRLTGMPYGGHVKDVYARARHRQKTNSRP